MPSNSVLTTLLAQQPPFIPAPAEVMVVTIDLPPGSPGTPPHRHSGPVFGYMLEGEMIFELEGEPERVIRAGEAFWEPGRPHDHPPGVACLHEPDSGNTGTVRTAI